MSAATELQRVTSQEPLKAEEEARELVDDKSSGGEEVEEEEETSAKGSSRVKLAVDLLLPVLCLLVIALAASTRDEASVPVKDDALCVYRVQLPFNLSAASNRVNPASYQVTPSGAASIDSVTELGLRPQAGLDVQRACVDKAPQLARAWRVLLALIPLIIVVQGILSLRLSSRFVAPTALVVAIVLGLSFYRDDAAYFVGDTDVEAMGKVALQIVDMAVWTVFEFTGSVLTAIFFLRVVQMWGVLDNMKHDFMRLSKRPLRQVLLVAFCFAMTLAPVAPGGSNFIIGASILIDMNVLNLSPGKDMDEANLRIGALSLFGNALTAAFGLLAIATTALGEEIAPLDLDTGGRSVLEQTTHTQENIAKDFAIAFFPFTALAPVIMAYLFAPANGFVAKLKYLRADFLILFSTGIVFAAVQLVTAWWISYPLVCFAAGGASMLYVVAYQRWFEKGDAGDERRDEPTPSRSYVVPFGLVFVLLFALGLVPGLADFLKGGDSEARSTTAQVLNPYILDVFVAAPYGSSQPSVRFTRRFGIFTHPGVLVALAAFATPFLIPYTAARVHPEEEVLLGTENKLVAKFGRQPGRLRAKVQRALRRAKAVSNMAGIHYDVSKRRWYVLRKALNEAVREVAPVLVSVTALSALAKLMGRFEMIQALAQALADLFGKDLRDLFVVAMPLIAGLGSSISGSTTTSALLFGSLQVRTATELGLVSSSRNSIYQVGAVQLLGSTIGEIVSPMNALVITLIKGVDVHESVLLRRVLWLAVLWTGGCIGMSLLLLSADTS